MQQCRRLLREYINGNYTVRIYSDGTKIRFSNDDEFYPIFPESIDLKITNQCDLRCPMCHEKSTPMGKEGDLNHPFFDTLVPGTELALGGGNPLSHSSLIPFLLRMKLKGIICNITVNQVHLIKHQELIQKLIDERLINGVGISITKDLFIEEIIDFLAKNPNSVVHVIAGIITPKLLEKLYDHNIKLLILGYKYVGRGESYFSDKNEENMNWLEQNILDISSHFSIVSFDNASIHQLKMKHKVEDYKTLYMGDDGEYTMYIDLVKKQFAMSSVTRKRYKLKENIVSMFNKVKKDKTLYHIKYYITTDDKEMLFAFLEEDDSYMFYYSEENGKWEFSGLRFRDIFRPTEEVDENVAAFITMGQFVEDLFEEMFGLCIYKNKVEEKEPVQDLIDSLIEFSKYRYEGAINKEALLNLSAKALEEAYHCGFYDLIKEHYEEINKRNLSYMHVDVVDDDYIVRIDEEILK